MKGKIQMMQQMMSDPSGFVDTKPMRGITMLLAQEEEQLQEAVAELVEATGADLDVDVHDSEERSERLRAGLKGMVNGDVPGAWVAHETDLEHADEAAEFASADVDEWTEQCAEWAERWRDSGLEGTDAELADAHIRSRYGVTKAAFEELVVEWDDDRVNDALRSMLAGPIEEATEQIEQAAETVREE